MRSECYHSLAAQTLMGVRWNLNFVTECMKINKIRSKSHVLKNLRHKNDSPCVCVVCFTVCSLLEPFGCRLILLSRVLDLKLYKTAPKQALEVNRQ